MVYTIADVVQPSSLTIVLGVIAVAYTLLWIRYLWEEFAPLGPIRVGLVNQRSGEHKYVKVGFSWVLLLFSGFLGIPLFLRRLHVWGAVFLALWVLCIFGPRLLVSQSTELGILSAIDLWFVLNIISLGLAIWIGIKGNEMTAKNLLENSWIFANPNAQESRFAMFSRFREFTVSGSVPTTAEFRADSFGTKSIKSIGGLL